MKLSKNGQVVATGLPSEIVSLKSQGFAEVKREKVAPVAEDAPDAEPVKRAPKPAK